jgi:hypothetical protein
VQTQVNRVAHEREEHVLQREAELEAKVCRGAWARVTIEKNWTTNIFSRQVKRREDAVREAGARAESYCFISRGRGLRRACAFYVIGFRGGCSGRQALLAKKERAVPVDTRAPLARGSWGFLSPLAASIDALREPRYNLSLGNRSIPSVWTPPHTRALRTPGRDPDQDAADRRRLRRDQEDHRRRGAPRMMMVITLSP